MYLAATQQPITTLQHQRTFYQNCIPCQVRMLTFCLSASLFCYVRKSAKSIQVISDKFFRNFRPCFFVRNIEDVAQNMKFGFSGYVVDGCRNFILCVSTPPWKKTGMRFSARLLNVQKARDLPCYPSRFVQHKEGNTFVGEISRNKTLAWNRVIFSTHFRLQLLGMCNNCPLKQSCQMIQLSALLMVENKGDINVILL